MDPDSETFAIRAAQTGSEKAWRQLFERHFDAVYGFCVTLAGGIDPRDSICSYGAIAGQTRVAGARFVREAKRVLY